MATRLRRSPRDSGRSGGLAPIRVLDVELGRPLPAIDAARSLHGHPYRRAHVLVRLHGWPLGAVNVELDPEQGTLVPAPYGAQLWRALGPAILEHLDHDGHDAVARLPVEGLGTGPCARRLPAADFPLVTVVVPTRDRAEYLGDCLDALLGLSYPRYEILVVDNAPGTATTADLVRGRFGHVRHLRYLREDRQGASHARNRGIQEAAGQILAFTDDDIRVDPEWLTALVGGFAAAPDVACVTGLVLPAALEIEPHLWVEEWLGGDKTFKRRVYDLDQHRGSSPLYPYSLGAFGAGASMAFTASALNTLGGFDPVLGPGSPAGGGEDLDLFFRVLAAGMRLVCEPAAIGRHVPRPDYRGLLRQVERNGVGFTAVLTKCLLDRPIRIVDLAAKVPLGLLCLLRSRSRSTRQADYPRELVRQELKGMVLGPGAYLRSRRAMGRAASRQGLHRT